MNDQSQNQLGVTVGFVSHARALALLLHHSKGHLPAPLLSGTTPEERDCFNQATAHLKFQLKTDEVYISDGIRGDLEAFTDGRLILAGNGIKTRLYFREVADPRLGAGPHQWWLRACTPEEAAERARSGKPLAILGHEAARGIFYLEELCPQAVTLSAGLDDNGIRRRVAGKAVMRYASAEAMEKDRMDPEEFDALRRAADAERAEERELRHFMAITLFQEGLGELMLRFPHSR